MASRRPSRGGRRSAPAPQSNAQQYMLVFGGVGGLLLVIVLVVMSGQKDKKPEPAPFASTPSKKTTAETQPKKPEPPAEVPAEFIRKVESAWPAIEKLGKEFEKHFKNARIAHKANKRGVLQTEIHAAQRAFESAQEAWAPIYYSADDYDDNVAEACRSWVRSYEKKVSGWTKRAKALKEFSTLD